MTRHSNSPENFESWHPPIEEEHNETPQTQPDSKATNPTDSDPTKLQTLKRECTELRIQNQQLRGELRFASGLIALLLLLGFWNYWQSTSLTPSQPNTTKERRAQTTATHTLSIPSLSISPRVGKTPNHITGHPHKPPYIRKRRRPPRNQRRWSSNSRRKKRQAMRQRIRRQARRKKRQAMRQRIRRQARRKKRQAMRQRIRRQARRKKRQAMRQRIRRQARRKKRQEQRLRHILQSEYRTLRSKHRTLRSKHRTLRSKHRTFRSKHRTFRSKHRTFRSKHRTFRSKHRTFRSKHRTLRRIARDKARRKRRVLRRQARRHRRVFHHKAHSKNQKSYSRHRKKRRRSGHRLRFGAPIPEHLVPDSWCHQGYRYGAYYPCLVRNARRRCIRRSRKKKYTCLPNHWKRVK